MYSLTVRVYSVRVFPSRLRNWGVSWDYNGRPYEWQRSVLSEPRRDWPGVVTELHVTRPMFRLYVLGNLPFHLPVPISSYSLSTRCACHLVAAWAAPPSPSEWVQKPLLHAPMSSCLSITTRCCLCCASPRLAVLRLYLVFCSSLQPWYLKHYKLLGN